MALLNENDEQSARDSLGGLVKIVTTFALLRLINVVCYRAPVDVLYGVALGDGLGGRFLFNSASVATDNGSTVIAPSPTPATGRWLLVAWPASSGGGGATDIFAYKTADEARAGGGSYLIDDDLQFTLDANSAYDFELYLFGQVVAASGRSLDWKLQAAGPDDTQRSLVTFMDATSEAVGMFVPFPAPSEAQGFLLGASGGDTELGAIVRGMYFTGADVPADVGLLWRVTGADPASVLKGSFLRFMKRSS